MNGPVLALFLLSPCSGDSLGQYVCCNSSYAVSVVHLASKPVAMPPDFTRVPCHGVQEVLLMGFPPLADA